jgi:hypothetical protein
VRSIHARWKGKGLEAKEKPYNSPVAKATGWKEAKCPQGTLS